MDPFQKNIVPKSKNSTGCRVIAIAFVYLKSEKLARAYGPVSNGLERLAE